NLLDGLLGAGAAVHRHVEALGRERSAGLGHDEGRLRALDLPVQHELQLGLGRRVSVPPRDDENEDRQGCAREQHGLLLSRTYLSISWSRSSDRRGVRVMRAPNGLRASSTAATSAAGGARAAVSPTPLTPRGLSGEGVSRLTIRGRGVWTAVGIA